MNIYLVTNKSNQFISQQKIFIDEANADNYILENHLENQKDLAYKTKLLQKETIQLKDELPPSEKRIYVLSELSDLAFYKRNIISGIKHSHKIVGFYGTIAKAEEDSATINRYRGNNMSKIDWIDIEDPVLTKSKKNKP